MITSPEWIQTILVAATLPRPNDAMILNALRFIVVPAVVLCALLAMRIRLSLQMRSLARSRESIRQEADRHLRLADELRESRQRLELVLEASNLAIWDRDLATGHLVVNERWAQMLGYTHDELECHTETWRDRIHPDDRDHVLKSQKEHLEGHTDRFETEYRIRHRSGNYIWLFTVGRVTRRDAQGTPLRLSGTNLDVTRVKHLDDSEHRMQIQTLQSQKLESLGFLAGGIAHDFNNLLMSILGHAGLIKGEALPEHQPGLAEIETAAERAADLCGQLLAYAGKGRFMLEPIHVNDTVAEIRTLMGATVSKKAVMRFHLADRLPPVSADASQFRQILVNLITNASEAIDDQSGVIVIKTATMDCDAPFLSSAHLGEFCTPGRYVYLQVADTGAGLDHEDQQRMFEPFYSTKFTGRGLGLAAVQGIVRAHSGCIKVDSQPGSGTRIRVLLPACEQPVKQRESSKASSPQAASVAGGTVMVVDDERSIRELSASMLKRLDFRTVTAEDGHEAIQVFKAHREEVVCVLMDLMMPNMDGEEAFTEINRIDGSIPVIITSGYAEKDLAQRFFGKHIAGILQKPYSIKMLSAKLQEALTSPEHSPATRNRDACVP